MGSISKYVGPQQGTPYALSTLSPKIELANLDAETTSLNKQVAFALSGKLKLIQSQIEHLQKQAETLVNEARITIELNMVPCSIQKRVGALYFLYERADGSQFFSILSPEDWGSMIPGKFKSCWKLEPDMNWKEIHFSDQ